MSNLTQAQLNELQGYADAGDRITYWTKLAEFQRDEGQSDRYAILALGVARDDTAAGQSAHA